MAILRGFCHYAQMQNAEGLLQVSLLGWESGERRFAQQATGSYARARSRWLNGKAYKLNNTVYICIAVVPNRLLGNVVKP